MEQVDKGLMKQLVEGHIADDDVNEMRRMAKKDAARFWTYLEVLQDKVSWNNPILMRVNDHLYIVRKGENERVVKCDCGHEYGDYRVNWKLKADIRVRDNQEKMEQVYYPAAAAPDPEWMEIREFYCPNCVAQLAVEVVPPGYPLTFEAFPDLDRFYREYMNRPLSDESPEWFQDKTADYIATL
ncbi:MAG: acetone carboxylase subunit gamma [Cycloclasticus sp.]